MMAWRSVCRCKARVVDIPSTCHICKLMLVSSPHLARSYHHLFPINPFEEISPQALSTLHVRSFLMQLVVAYVRAVELSTAPQNLQILSILAVSTSCKGSALVEGLSALSRRCCRVMNLMLVQGSSLQAGKDDWQECNARVWCYGCIRPLAALASLTLPEDPGVVVKCPDCQRVFCFDCDAYIHESLHNCPGCECIAADEGMMDEQ